MSVDVEVSILTCPHDTDFLGITVPHLINSLVGLNALRTLLVDWMPVTGHYSKIYPPRQEEKFMEICDELVAMGCIDRVVRIPYDEKTVAALMDSAFQGKFRATHNIRGYPIYGSIYAVLSTKKRYLVHFDADMMIHQGGSKTWIEYGISLLDRHDDVGAVMPRSGPPTHSGIPYQGSEKFEHDPRGFHSFSSFSSRVYLIDVLKFRSLHPVEPLWLGRRDKIRSFFDGRGQALSWESIITKAFRQKSLRRADLLNHDSWSLHPPSRTKLFYDYLPDIIAAVEAGVYPPEQSGHYDLCLEHWPQFLEQRGSHLTE